MNSLAKYLALQYIQRYIAEFNEIECCSSQYSGKNQVTLTMKRIEAGRQFPHDKAVALAACRQPGGCRRILYIGSERKNSVRKTGERYKHREEKVRQRCAEARGNSAPLPHMAHSNRILVLKHEFLANE